jgi:hypothetical protein
LNMAKTTAFRWRHRFLQSAQPGKASELTGVVEADETFFLHSRKASARADNRASAAGRRRAKSEAWT